ncbi:MAG: hypothetical protein Q8P11_02070 [bacterium]|nr:hypothetical protein [bacterium]
MNETKEGECPVCGRYKNECFFISQSKQGVDVIIELTDIFNRLRYKVLKLAIKDFECDACKRKL